MDFEITSEHLSQFMYPGMIVTYIVRPLLGLPIHWVTEITQVEKMKFFVDEQRIGPYRLWHHQHFFREVRDGVEVETWCTTRRLSAFWGDSCIICLLKDS